MIRTQSKNWLLALCGVLNAICSAIFLVYDAGFHAWGPIALLGGLALAAGVCAIAAGLGKCGWGARGLLALHGLALSGLGLLLTGVLGERIGFHSIALLLVVMALSMGALEWIAARTLRRQRHVAGAWAVGLAAAGSAGFGVAFVALGFGWIAMGPGSNADLLWIGSYFAFSAICMLFLGLRLRRLDSSGLDRLEALPA